MLHTIVESVRSKLNSRPRIVWQREIDARLERIDKGVSFRNALAAAKESFIFEIKRTSPSSNGSAASLNVTVTAQSLQRCGAAALSVLTEPDFFGGSLSDLAEARRAVSIPLLRKDFIIDKLQIAEARAFGADAVLLIAAVLTDEQLAAFIEFAASLHLDSLVEVHDARELHRAVTAGAEIIGVNNRDLRTMEIDLAAGARLLRLVPGHCMRVAESGLKTRTDVLMMREAGADAFLIGTAVMRSGNMEAAIKELTGVN